MDEEPQIGRNFAEWPAGYLFPVLAVMGSIGIKTFLGRKHERNAFLSYCAYLTGMLTSVVFGVYPMVLPARDPAYSLTLDSAKAGTYGLKVGLAWWVMGMLLATGYSAFVYRSFAGKVKLDAYEHGQGH